FGIAGERTQNVLYRVTNGELEGVNPKVIVLMIGTNNLNYGVLDHEDAAADDISRGIKACVDVMRSKAPDAKIILMGITARNVLPTPARRGEPATMPVAPPDPVVFMPIINKINDRIVKLADGRSIWFLNINDKLADKDGRLYPGMTGDGLHLSDKGYQIW